MKHRLDHPGLDALVLPDDLKSLDAELSSIRYEERPSFGPELEGELAKAWLTRTPAQRPWARRLAVAAVIALLLVGTTVPSARASLVRFIGTLQTEEVAPVEGPEVTVPAEAAPQPVDSSDAIVELRPPVIAEVVPVEVPTPPIEVPVEWPAPTLPVLVDREEAEASIREAYPLDLQRAGVGGSVRVLLWIDPRGSVDNVNLDEGSGVPALDRAALLVAPSFRFRPASRRGQSVGTWVEFDVIFQPMAQQFGQIAGVGDGAASDPNIFDPSVGAAWRGTVDAAAPVGRETSELLATAIDDDEVIARLGPVESMLVGEPPPGVGPTQWRSDVSAVLEDAMERNPDNPAPLLALARIRRRQGLKGEARALFERGLQRAVRSDSRVSPSLFADLHYERGLLIKEGWQASNGLGRVRADALDLAACPQAASSGGSEDGYASADRLIAWNYLCPAELDEIFSTGFEPSYNSGPANLDVMTASFRTAIAAHPVHVGANVEVLLALSEQGRWEEVLEASERFARASNRHPYGLLLGGLALQRLSRPEEARDRFTLAMLGLPAHEVNALKDLRFVLDRSQLAEYRRTTGVQRRNWEDRFWVPLDPILSTAVNERAIEHLARAAHARLRYGDVQSDASEVLIRYGEPNRLRVVGELGGPRTEFWNYGTGPHVTFTGLGPTPATELTQEGRAYVNDLRDVFVHRYGTDARDPVPLAVEFEAHEGTGLQVQMRVDVPDEFEVEEQRLLELGVFLLDASGALVSSTVIETPAVEGPVSLEASVSAEIATVVVELFDPASGRVAVFRDAVPPPSDGLEPY